MNIWTKERRFNWKKYCSFVPTYRKQSLLYVPRVDWNKLAQKLFLEISLNTEMPVGNTNQPKTTLKDFGFRCTLKQKIILNLFHRSQTSLEWIPQHETNDHGHSIVFHRLSMGWLLKPASTSLLRELYILLNYHFRVNSSLDVRMACTNMFGFQLCFCCSAK